MANAIRAYQKGMTDAEDSWQETLRESRRQTELLSENEIKDSLAVVGATQQRMVDEPTEYFQKKINKTKTMDEKFENLSKEIKNKIDELIQRDKELAQQLRS